MFDYTKVDFATQITEPVDIVLDSAMDQSTFGTGLLGEIGKKNYSVIKDGGIYISLVAFAINQYPKVHDIDAYYFQARPSRPDFESIVHHMKENKLSIYIDETYPFTAQGLLEAYRKSEEMPKRGKIVISKNMV